MTKEDKAIAEGIAFKHNLHTESPNINQIISAMEEYNEYKTKKKNKTKNLIDGKCPECGSDDIKTRYSQNILAQTVKWLECDDCMEIIDTEDK